jgi:hypothetical protein
MDVRTELPTGNGMAPSARKRTYGARQHEDHSAMDRETRRPRRAALETSWTDEELYYIPPLPAALEARINRDWMAEALEALRAIVTTDPAPQQAEAGMFVVDVDGTEVTRTITVRVESECDSDSDCTSLNGDM